MITYKPKIKTSIIAILFLCLLTNIAVILLVEPKYSIVFIRTAIAFEFLVIALYFGSVYLIGNRDIFSFDKLFSFAFILFHLGYLIPFSIGAVEYNDNIFWDLKIVTKATFVVTLALNSFLFGYSFATNTKVFAITRNKLIVNASMGAETWFIIGKIILFLGLFLVAIFVVNIGIDVLIFRKYGFNIFYSGEYSTTLFGGGKLLIAIGVAVLLIEIMAKKRISGFNCFTFICVICYFTFLLVFGVRSWIAIDFIIPLLLSFHYFVRKIQGREALAFLTLILIVSVVVERGRLSEDRTISSFIYTLQSSFEQQQLNGWELSSRLGITIKNVYREMSLVPNSSDYLYGSSILGSLVESIPLLGSKILPDSYESPDRWMSKYTDPWAYNNYEGIGFSIVSEAHINFGIPGVVFLLFIYGFVSCRIYENAMAHPKIGHWILYVIYCSNFLFAIRQDLTAVFRPLWVIIFASVLVRLLISIQSNKKVRNQKDLLPI